MQRSEEQKSLSQIPEARNFSRTIAEIECLLLLIVILFLVSSGNELENRQSLTLCLTGFGFFVFFSNFKSDTLVKNQWYLAIKIWIMLVFITWVVLNTGKIHSPLIDLYLLVIIITALTQNKTTSLLQLCLISCCCLYLNYLSAPENHLLNLRDLAIKLVPVWLVFYLTTILSIDINQAQEKIKRLAETDPLTGKLNTRAFRIVLEQEQERSLRYHHHFAILMVDSDNLKTTNDVYGHSAGDALIQFTANQIEQCLRQNDTLARFGGDEFLVLLPETDLENASLTAERIRKTMSETPVPFETALLKTSVSIGVTCFPEHASQIAELLHNVDAALYRSKLDGRNRVTVFVKNQKNQ